MASLPDRLGYATRYTYDANRNLIALTDPLGQTPWYTYDADTRKSRSNRSQLCPNPRR